MTTKNYKHRITNEIVQISQLLFSHVTFLSLEFIETVLLTFVGIVFVTFADKLSLTFIISSPTITKVSEVLFKYLLFSQNTCAKIPTIMFFARAILPTLTWTCIIIPS